MQPDPTAKPAPPAPDDTAQVMLLCVWPAAGAGWRARVVLPDGQLCEFSSPFALARHLYRLQRPPTPDLPGLR